MLASTSKVKSKFPIDKTPSVKVQIPLHVTLAPNVTVKPATLMVKSCKTLLATGISTPVVKLPPVYIILITPLKVGILLKETSL